MQIKTPLTATKYRADDATLRDATGRVIGTMSMADAEALAAPGAVVQAAPTEAQVAHAARALADRHALACNVNKDDNWRVYGEEFTADARFVLDAARGAA